MFPTMYKTITLKCLDFTIFLHTTNFQTIFKNIEAQMGGIFVNESIIIELEL